MSTKSSAGASTQHSTVGALFNVYVKRLRKLFFCVHVCLQDLLSLQSRVNIKYGRVKMDKEDIVCYNKDYVNNKLCETYFYNYRDKTSSGTMMDGIHLTHRLMLPFILLIILKFKGILSPRENI